MRVCMIPEGKSDGYYMLAAKNQAITYIKSKENNYAWNNKFPHISLESMERVNDWIDTEYNVYGKLKGLGMEVKL